MLVDKLQCIFEFVTGLVNLTSVSEMTIFFSSKKPRNEVPLEHAVVHFIPKHAAQSKDAVDVRRTLDENVFVEFFGRVVLT